MIYDTIYSYEEDVMTIPSYLFQSPSPQQVQVGRPDPSTAKEETETKSETDDSPKTAIAEVETTPELRSQEPQELTLTSPNQILDLYV